MKPTVTLYRPTGPQELALVEASGFRRWPPRLPEQPIFYPVTNAAYAIEIARDWNVPASGQGFVTRFEVRRSFMEAYAIHRWAPHTTRNGGYRRRTWKRSTTTSRASSTSSSASARGRGEAGPMPSRAAQAFLKVLGEHLSE